jgi:hypothetical protein
VLALTGGAADEEAARAVASASEITLAIRRERSQGKMAFGVPGRTLVLPGTVRSQWPAIAADVLAGNNASQAAVSFGEAFLVEFNAAP